MSTFVFAPSWVNYPNQPKSLKETDDFPTLNIKQQQPKNKNSNNVWSNPHLIRKIHNSNDDQQTEDDEEMEEKRYQLERLKALVPKTIRSTSNSSSSTCSSSSTTQCTSTNKKTTSLRKPNNSGNRKSLNFQTINNITHNNNPKATTTTITTTTTTTPKTTSPVSFTIKEDKEPPKDVISKQEQESFIYFIRSWTSTGITNSPHHQYKEYSYFDFNHNNTSSRSSSSSNDSTSNSSNDSIASNDSFFYYHPFPPTL